MALRAEDSIGISSQYKYKGRGPLDAKALVATYADLVDNSTWQESNNCIAYNGMIVAVGLDDSNSTKNGIYYLHDPILTTDFFPPDVAKEVNWHKLADETELTALGNDLTTLAAIVNDSQNGLVSRVNVAEARLSSAEQKIQTLQDQVKNGVGTGETFDRLHSAVSELQTLTGDSTKGNEALYTAICQTDSRVTGLGSTITTIQSTAMSALDIASAALSKVTVVESDYLKESDGFILSCGTSAVDVFAT